MTVQRAAEYWGVTPKAARERFKKAPERYSINNSVITENGKI